MLVEITAEFQQAGHVKVSRLEVGIGACFRQVRSGPSVLNPPLSALHGFLAAFLLLSYHIENEMRHKSHYPAAAKRLPLPCVTLTNGPSWRLMSVYAQHPASATLTGGRVSLCSRDKQWSPIQIGAVFDTIPERDGLTHG